VMRGRLGTENARVGSEANITGRIQHFYAERR